MLFISKISLWCVYLFSGLMMITGISNSGRTGKINGVNFVAPPNKIGHESFDPVVKMEAKWVALNPFGYSRSGEPGVCFDSEKQWWGETTKGTMKLALYAKLKGLKVLIKPHVWVRGEGWPGNFDLKSEGEWKQWEDEYEKYILDFATLSQVVEADMFCIGVEYRVATRKRPQFWLQLIDKVKARYKGPVTYAANWDDYETILFWNKLDYIGIDAYFPLLEETSPTVKELVSAWKPHYEQIDAHRLKLNKPVLFTEYGYRSMDKTAWKQWELEDDWRCKGECNLEVQCNAYDALYRVFWDQPWFAGGFIWKWYDNHTGAGGSNNNDYTPQNKPVESIIKSVYQKSNL